jgi:hypothetical protein
MDKGVVKHHYYMTTMNENVNKMKLTHMLSKISLNLGAPFCTKISIANLNVHSKENEYLPLMYITYTNA